MVRFACSAAAVAVVFALSCLVGTGHSAHTEPQKSKEYPGKRVLINPAVSTCSGVSTRASWLTGWTISPSNGPSGGYPQTLSFASSYWVNASYNSSAIYDVTWGLQDDDDPNTYNGLSLCSQRNFTLGWVPEGNSYILQTFYTSSCTVLAWNSVSYTMYIVADAAYAAGDYKITVHSYYDSYRTDNLYCLEFTFSIE